MRELQANPSAISAQQLAWERQLRSGERVQRGYAAEFSELRLSSGVMSSDWRHQLEQSDSPRVEDANNHQHRGVPALALPDLTSVSARNLRPHGALHAN